MRMENYNNIMGHQEHTLHGGRKIHQVLIGEEEIHQVLIKWETRKRSWEPNTEIYRWT